MRGGTRALQAHADGGALLTERPKNRERERERERCTSPLPASSPLLCCSGSSAMNCASLCLSWSDGELDLPAGPRPAPGLPPPSGASAPPPPADLFGLPSLGLPSPRPEWAPRSVEVWSHGGWGPWPSWWHFPARGGPGGHPAHWWVHPRQPPWGRDGTPHVLSLIWLDAESCSLGQMPSPTPFPQEVGNPIGRVVGSPIGTSTCGTTSW